MSLALVLTATVLSSAVGDMVRHRIGPLSFELPVAWRQSSRTGTVQFDSAQGDAYMLLDVTQPEADGLTPKACLDIILGRLERRNEPSRWGRRTIDVFAVATSTSFDRSANLANTARVEQIVGCDGQFAWSIVFFIDLSASTHYGDVVANVLATLKATGADPKRPSTLEDNVRDEPRKP